MLFFLLPIVCSPKTSSGSAAKASPQSQNSPLSIRFCSDSYWTLWPCNWVRPNSFYEVKKNDRRISRSFKYSSNVHNCMSVYFYKTTQWYRMLTIVATTYWIIYFIVNQQWSAFSNEFLFYVIFHLFFFSILIEIIFYYPCIYMGFKLLFGVVVVFFFFTARIFFWKLIRVVKVIIYFYWKW